MRIKFICAAVTRTFTMVALGSFFVSVDLAIAGPSVQEQLKGSCYARQTSNGHVSRYKDSVNFYTKAYSTASFGNKKGMWNSALKIQQELKAKNCQGQIRNYATKFFRAALKANDKSCSNKDSLCAEYNNWAQNLYESALKNDDTIIRDMLDKHSSYIREKRTQILKNIEKKAAEDMKNKAAKEEAAKKKAAEEEAKKKEAEEEAKKKAAAEDMKNKAAKEEAAAKIKAAKEKAAAAQETKEDSSYILKNESLMEMFGDLPKQYQQLANIKNINIEKLIDQTKMKTINSQGITRTMYCNPCTLGSPLLISNRTGINMGFPKVIHDGINEALIEVFDGENPLKKSQIIKLGISSYKEIAKTINDPNINKAMAMPAEQLKQIKAVQTQVQASRQKKSDGSAEEGPGTASAMSSGSSPPSSEEGPGTASAMSSESSPPSFRSHEAPPLLPLPPPVSVGS